MINAATMPKVLPVRIETRDRFIWGAPLTTASGAREASADLDRLREVLADKVCLSPRDPERYARYPNEALAARAELDGLLYELPRESRRVSVPSLCVAGISVPTPLAPEVDPFPVFEAALRDGADVIVAPEWMFMPSADHRAFRDVVERLRDMTRGWSGVLMPGTMALVDRRGRYRNLGLVFSDGRVLTCYAKQSEGQDRKRAEELGVIQGEPVAWDPGSRNGFFAWRDMQVGLEICADHPNARARLARLIGAQPPLAVQLVSACGLSCAYQQGVACGVGGLFVLADKKNTTIGAHTNRKEIDLSSPIAPAEGTWTSVGAATMLTVRTQPT